MRPLRNEDGEILYDGNGDDRRPIEVPDVQVGQLWLRLLERRAKLYGLDMQSALGGAPPPTREVLAAVTGWDATASGVGSRPTRSRWRGGNPPARHHWGKGLIMSLDQKRARWFGVLYLMTFITSIPALWLYQPVLDDPVGYIAGAGHDKRILFGALLELLLIIANIGTAVVIVPIMRRQFEDLSIGYVTARLFECTFILVGIIAVLGIITLRNEAAGANEGTIAYTLAAIKDWTFLLGPGWVVGWGNGLILGYMMYRTQLVPRPWPWLGLIGGPLIIITGTIVMFGGNHPSSTLDSLKGLLSIPDAAWELFLGVYCTIWGFRREAPILSENAR
jgi:hypothetical protein